MSEIDQASWDACALAGVRDPFLSWQFLQALEASGSAVPETGWAPCHLALEQAGEAGPTQLLGVVPMYLKSHSQGEYVFDYAWADAFERAGGRYYPKLQVAVPFTPASGRRILVNPNACLPPSMQDSVGSLDRNLAADGQSQASMIDLERTLIAGLMQVAEQMGVSSVHLTFIEQRQWAQLGELGFLQRTHNQFHWLNPGYSCFDDFLAALSSKKRKQIKRERRLATETGIEIERLTGSDLTEGHWDAFYRFYMDTGSRKWGSPYLTREFFSLVGQGMADDILLVMCKRDGRYIAGAINFIGGDCLFGRNWGCIEDHPFLHFETCYYQAIEFAIERRLARVEAGAQGEHKLARGYIPSLTYSAHWVANASFRDAVEGFLASERRYVEEEVGYMQSAHSPFRKG